MKLYTPAGLGEEWGCSEDTVMRLIASGELGSVDIAPRGSKRSKTRIPEDAAARFVGNRARKTSTEPPGKRSGVRDAT